MYKVTVTRHKHNSKKAKQYVKFYQRKTDILNLYNQENAFVFFVPDSKNRVCTTPALDTFKIEKLIVSKELSIREIIKETQGKK